MFAYKFVFKKKVSWIDALLFGVVVAIVSFVIQKFASTDSTFIVGMIILYLAAAAVAKYYAKLKKDQILRIAALTVIFAILINFVAVVLGLALLGAVLVGLST